MQHAIIGATWMVPYTTNKMKKRNKLQQAKLDRIANKRAAYEKARKRKIIAAKNQPAESKPE